VRLIDLSFVHKVYAVALTIALSCVLPTLPRAHAQEGWHAYINNHSELPPLFLAVDKAQQKFFILERHSPLKVRGSYVCTTGQVEGDKLYEGDLRTPEGVYFIVTKLSSGLDFAEYGGIAYTLNYPNPVDRLKRKTGHGIWIHSRGQEITPLETRGCIALNLPDLLSIGDDFSIGMPITIGHSLEIGEDSANIQAISAELADKTKAWAAAWSGRSKTMFDFYDAESYSIANESFSAFRSNKERLFQLFPWLHTIISNVYAKPGPDYWVTWFNQYYRAPNMTTEGIRRLYWQKDATDTFRIVGMEWLPRNLGMAAEYLETVAPDIFTFIETWRAAWEGGDLAAYTEAYAPNAVQGNRRGRAAIVQHKETLWSNITPVKVELSGIFLATDSGGIKVDMHQNYNDSRGFSDRGTKTLILTPTATGWAIVREDWTAAS
jgi:ketosteroid isomerase-like protein